MNLQIESGASGTFRLGDFSAKNAYRFQTLVSADEDGVVSIVALTLPGLGSCGETEQEAIENFKEAAAGILASYREEGKDIPWKDATPPDTVRDGKIKWITAYA